MARQVVVGYYTDKKGQVRPISKTVMSGKRGRSKKYRPRARDFGDNPKIRHSHREHKQTNLKEPWEVEHAIKTGKLREVRK